MNHRSHEDTLEEIDMRADENVEALIKQVGACARDYERAVIEQVDAIEQHAKQVRQAEAAFQKALDELQGYIGSKRYANRGGA